MQSNSSNKHHILKTILYGSAIFAITFIALFLFAKVSSEQLPEEAAFVSIKDLGKVKGEEDIKSIPAPYASENYGIKQMVFGGSLVVLTENNDNSELQISDIRSEVLSTSNQKENKLLVAWKTNKLTLSELEYGKASSNDSKIIQETSYGFNHSAVLANLEHGTAYNFVIRVKDRWGNTATSNRFAAYSGSKAVSVFELISNALDDTFGWAVK